MDKHSFQIDLIPELEGGYTVVVPQLPGCVSYGKNVEEAKKNAMEAIKLHLDNLRAHNKKSLGSITKSPVLSTVVQITTSYA